MARAHGMKPLRVKFVEHPPYPVEQLAPDTVQVCVRVSTKNNVDVSIARQGFVVAYPVMHTIKSRIRQIEGMSPKSGLYPAMNAEWQRFFSDLLQQEDSWAFVVPDVGLHSLS
jgi:hypothetical protein